MICPNCQAELEQDALACPDCGLKIRRKVSGIVKTSTVLIGAGKTNTFYRSVQDVPENLRRKLIETTNGENSGTIVIADQAGKEQWTEIVAQREAPAREIPAEPEAEPVAVRGFAGLPWAAWAGLLLFLGAAALVASVFQVFRTP